MNRLITLFFISLFVSQALWAQQEAASGQDTSDEVELLIAGMGKISATEYNLKVDDIRGKLEKYIENKKRVCEGDFSTVILSKGERESGAAKKPVKLSKEEREVCFRELKQIQQKYIEASYEAKKRFLVYLHGERLKELEQSKEDALKHLINSFNKKGRR